MNTVPLNAINALLPQKSCYGFGLHSTPLPLMMSAGRSSTVSLFRVLGGSCSSRGSNPCFRCRITCRHLQIRTAPDHFQQCAHRNLVDNRVENSMQDFPSFLQGEVRIYPSHVCVTGVIFTPACLRTRGLALNVPPDDNSIDVVLGKPGRTQHTSHSERTANRKRGWKHPANVGGPSRRHQALMRLDLTLLGSR